MVGRATVTVKPSRSDEVLDPDQQLRIAEQVRAQIDSMLPKRPPKPNRSDPDLSVTTDEAISSIPELDKFQSLRSQSPVIFSPENQKVEDEFVETGYYRELDSIDKQHHTTGSGFINVTSEKGKSDEYDFQLQTENENGAGFKELIFKSNPATNDWIPSADHYQVEYVSTKPSRSDSDNDTVRLFGGGRDVVSGLIVVFFFIVRR